MQTRKEVTHMQTTLLKELQLLLDNTEDLYNEMTILDYNDESDAINLAEKVIERYELTTDILLDGNAPLAELVEYIYTSLDEI